MARGIIGWLKRGRRVAIRYDQDAQCCLGFLYLAAAWIWLKSNSTLSSTLSCFNYRVQVLEADAGVLGAELPVEARLGGVAVLRPGGDLRVDGGLRGQARGQGLPRQAAQFRFGPVEPAAVPGRKPQAYASGQAARLGGRKGPVERGAGMGVQIVADQDLDKARVAKLGKVNYVRDRRAFPNLFTFSRNKFTKVSFILFTRLLQSHTCSVYLVFQS